MNKIEQKKPHNSGTQLVYILNSHFSPNFYHKNIYDMLQ